MFRSLSLVKQCLKPTYRNKSSFECLASPAPGSPFHLAIPVHCLDKAKEFYEDILELKQGRRHEGKWQDYSIFGLLDSAEKKSKTTPLNISFITKHMC